MAEDYGSVEFAKLLNTPVDTWSNTILWKLALAIGAVHTGDGEAMVDPDYVLEMALEYIWRYRELEY